jgi:hypothetical protein
MRTPTMRMRFATRRNPPQRLAPSLQAGGHRFDPGTLHSLFAGGEVEFRTSNISPSRLGYAASLGLCYPRGLPNHVGRDGRCAPGFLVSLRSSSFVRVRSSSTSSASAACLRSAPRSARTFLHAVASFSGQRRRSESIRESVPVAPVSKAHSSPSRSRSSTTSAAEPVFSTTTQPSPHGRRPRPPGR